MFALYSSVSPILVDSTFGDSKASFLERRVMGLMGVFVDDLDIKEGVEGTKKPSAGLRHNARKTRIRLISLGVFVLFW